MAQTTVNPYKEIGGYIPTGLAYINTHPNSTIDDLVNTVYAYIASVFYPSPTTQVEIEIKSIARTAINSYVNSLVMGGQASYNANQLRFIRMLIWKRNDF